MPLQPKQTTQQHLLLAPSVALALEVLRMSTMELRAFLERQLEENPLLELDESDDVQEAEAEAPSNEANGAKEPAEATLEEEWLAHWHTSDERETNEPENPEERGAADQWIMNARSLHEFLELQLGCQRLGEQEQRLGQLMIDHVDESGYLDGALEELAAEAGIPLEQLAAALKRLQGFDPPGVGARDLRECLLIQLERAQETESLAHRIVRDHFQLFAAHHLAALAKAVQDSVEAVTRACERLTQLNPKPGSLFVGDLPPTVIPDLLVHRTEHHYDVELNDQEVPRLAVNRFYYRMLKDPATPKDAKEFLTNKLRRATWLMKAIDERNTTLLSIARCLISLQGEFLEQGARALKPLTQAQVAGLIGRHPSTVSRAIAGKTIDTPYGVFRLEQLFASGIPQRHLPTPSAPTASISDAAIKSEIQRLVGQEDPQHPLSDAAIAHCLAQHQMLVARRTIAKYRAELKILPAHLRKRHIKTVTE